MLSRFVFYLLLIHTLSYSQSSQQFKDKDTRNRNLPADTTFVRLNDYSDAFDYNMKYATEDNFLKSKVYDCGTCYLRFKTVKALIEANKRFLKKGYRIQLFDCYRPLDVQKKMWEIVSNPSYVANPSKGSIHNRGGAVDLTLITLEGELVDMGTPFDFFGEEASHSYPLKDKTIRDNRKLLKKIMLKSGFSALDSEWWHYNLIDAKEDKLSNTKWLCD